MVMGFFNIPAPKSSAAGQKQAEAESTGNGGYFKIEKGVQMNVPAGHMPLSGKMVTPAGLGGNPMAGTNPFRKLRKF
jgi:hypothetical protein